MKKYFLFVLALLLFTTSCKKCRECLGSCNTLLVDAFFLNEGFDATGDNFNTPFVKYIVDSIRYQVIAQYDTTELLKPEIIGSEIHKFRFRYSISSSLTTNKTSWYYFIVHLNDIERDTIKVFYNEGETYYNTYLSDSLAANTDCDGTPAFPEMAIAGLCLAKQTNCDGIPYSIKFFK